MVELGGLNQQRHPSSIQCAADQHQQSSGSDSSWLQSQHRHDHTPTQTKGKTCLGEVPCGDKMSSPGFPDQLGMPGATIPAYQSPHYHRPATTTPVQTLLTYGEMSENGHVGPDISTCEAFSSTPMCSNGCRNTMGTMETHPVTSHSHQSCATGPASLPSLFGNSTCPQSMSVDSVVSGVLRVESTPTQTSCALGLLPSCITNNFFAGGRGGNAAQFSRNDFDIGMTPIRSKGCENIVKGPHAVHITPHRHQRHPTCPSRWLQSPRYSDGHIRELGDNTISPVVPAVPTAPCTVSMIYPCIVDCDSRGGRGGNAAQFFNNDIDVLDSVSINSVCIGVNSKHHDVSRQSDVVSYTNPSQYNLTTTTPTTTPLTLRLRGGSKIKSKSGGKFTLPKSNNSKRTQQENRTDNTPIPTKPVKTRKPCRPEGDMDMDEDSSVEDVDDDTSIVVDEDAMGDQDYHPGSQHKPKSAPPNSNKSTQGSIPVQSCELCKQGSFTIIGHLAEHYRKSHGSAAWTAITTPAASKYCTICPTCQLPFSKGIGVTNHIKRCKGRSTKTPAHQPSRPYTPTITAPVSITAQLQQLAAATTAPEALPTEPAQRQHDQPITVQEEQHIQTFTADHHDEDRVLFPDEAFAGAFYCPRKSLHPFKQLTSRIMQSMCDSGDAGRPFDDEHILAFIFLPSLLTFPDDSKEASTIHVSLSAACKFTKPTLFIWGGINKLQEHRRQARHSTRQTNKTPPPAQTQASNIRKRVHNLVRNGNVGKACRALEASLDCRGVAPPCQDTQDKIAALFPAGTEHDMLPDVPADIEAIQFTVEEVQAGIRALPKQTSPGMSSWTYDLIRQMAEEDIIFITLATKLLNHMARGMGGDTSVWLRSRCVPLIKPCGGVRPICVGEAWPQILGRLIARKVSKAAGDYMVPLQWGIGVAGGGEVVAHLGHIYADIAHATNTGEDATDLGIQQIDFSNAFNSVRRRPIWNQLVTHAPHLLPFFKWSYGTATTINLSSGDIACECQTGVRQGDPLGPYYFCLALQPVLEAVKREMDGRLVLFAYMDDTYLWGPQQFHATYLHCVARHAKAIGLSVKASKCARFVPKHRHLEDKDSTEGTIMLGTPIGTPTFCQEQAHQITTKYANLLPILRDYDVSVAYPILQACVNTRPTYLARTCPVGSSLTALGWFDGAVDEALLHLTRSHWDYMSEAASIIRALPHDKGGLGIRALLPTAPAAWSASFAHALYTMAPHITELMLNHRRQDWMPRLTELQKVVPTCVDVNVRNPGEGIITLPFSPQAWRNRGSSLVQPSAPPRQRELCKDIDRKKLDHLDYLLKDDPKAKAWSVSCRFKGSGSWLQMAATGPPPLRMSDEVLRHNLCLRLLLDPVDSTSFHHIQCGRCKLTSCGDNPIDSRTHGLTCQSSKGFHFTRHQWILSHIKDFLITHLGREHVTECHIRSHADQERPDLQVTVQGVMYFLDVSVVCPVSFKYVSKDSTTRLGAAAEMMYEEKLRKYQEYLLAIGAKSHQLIPLIFETSGFMHSGVKDFLNSTCSTAIRHNNANRFIKDWRFLTSRIKATIARSNSVHMSQFYIASTYLSNGGGSRPGCNEALKRAAEVATWKRQDKLQRQEEAQARFKTAKQVYGKHQAFLTFSQQQHQDQDQDQEQTLIFTKSALLLSSHDVVDGYVDGVGVGDVGVGDVGCRRDSHILSKHCSSSSSSSSSMHALPDSAFDGIDWNIFFDTTTPQQSVDDIEEFDDDDDDVAPVPRPRPRRRQFLTLITHQGPPPPSPSSPSDDLAISTRSSRAGPIPQDEFHAQLLVVDPRAIKDRERAQRKVAKARARRMATAKAGAAAGSLEQSDTAADAAVNLLGPDSNLPTTTSADTSSADQDQTAAPPTSSTPTRRRSQRIAGGQNGLSE